MNKGFTLIELLIVIMVIAILIGIALPRFRGMQEEGDLAKAKGELRTIQAAVESYYIHNARTYPADAALTNVEGASPNIINAVPNDPFNSPNDYGWDLSANGRYYIIYSAGPGGDGSATIADDGTITETNGDSCIYVSNADQDTRP